jgi:hypothetical protein
MSVSMEFISWSEYCTSNHGLATAQRSAPLSPTAQPENNAASYTAHPLHFCLFQRFYRRCCGTGWEHELAYLADHGVHTCCTPDIMHDCMTGARPRAADMAQHLVHPTYPTNKSRIPLQMVHKSDASIDVT